MALPNNFQMPGVDVLAGLTSPVLFTHWFLPSDILPLPKSTHWIGCFAPQGAGTGGVKAMNFLNEHIRDPIMNIVHSGWLVNEHMAYLSSVAHR